MMDVRCYIFLKQIHYITKVIYLSILKSLVVFNKLYWNDYETCALIDLHPYVIIYHSYTLFSIISCVKLCVTSHEINLFLPIYNIFILTLHYILQLINFIWDKNLYTILAPPSNNAILTQFFLILMGYRTI